MADELLGLIPRNALPAETFEGLTGDDGLVIVELSLHHLQDGLAQSLFSRVHGRIEKKKSPP